MDFGRSQIARAKYSSESETDGQGRQRDRRTCTRDRKTEKDGPLNRRQTGRESERQTELSRDRLIVSETDVQGAETFGQTDTSKKIGKKVEREIVVAKSPRKILYSEEGDREEEKDRGRQNQLAGLSGGC